MAIYTKRGDKGNTELVGARECSKADPVFDVLGNMDELNASLGFLSKSRLTDVIKIIDGIQDDLFWIGARLANKTTQEKDFDPILLRVSEIEKTIDTYEAKLPKLTNFILPGGTEPAVRLHFCRVVCRRWERSAVKYFTRNPGASGREPVLIYANRLSDLLFVLARYANKKNGVKDKIWKGNL